MVGVPGWEQLPQWIAAIATAAAFVAAAFAAFFAWKAARHTADQTVEAKKQTGFADEQTALAKQALDLTRQEALDARAAARLQLDRAEQADRRLAQDRLDALAPTIWACATPGIRPSIRPLEYRELLPRSAEPDWKPVEAEMRVGADQMLAFRTVLTIEFKNISGRLGNIDVIDPAAGESPELKAGQTLVVPPGEAKSITWTRQLTSQGLGDDAAVADPRYWLFNLRFWVRDLGMNVRDTYVFNGALRYFTRDGSMLVVAPQQDIPWTENHAALLPGRVYERLDAPPAEPQEPEHS